MEKWDFLKEKTNSQLEKRIYILNEQLAELGLRYGTRTELYPQHIKRTYKQLFSNLSHTRQELINRRIKECG